MKVEYLNSTFKFDTTVPKQVDVGVRKVRSVGNHNCVGVGKPWSMRKHKTVHLH